MTGSTAVVGVETEAGAGRLHLNEAARPAAVLLLGHGAGGGVDAFDLAALANALPPRGVSVARFEQPWRVAGRRVAGRPPTLDGPWRQALHAVTTAWPGLPLVVGGRSAGARVACRCWREPALGVVALSFPLHPPGRPGASRAEELRAVGAPVLLVSGAADPFASPAELRAAFPERELVLVPGAGHSLAPTRRADHPAERARQVTAPVERFISALLTA